MNLRDLQYLVAVADHLHFGKAAEYCHVSQPTLSMQLKKLEERLGVQLIERSNKHVLFTSIGQDITTRARRILNEAEHIKTVAANARDPLSGDLRLGIFPTLAPYLLPRIMPSLHQALPALNLLLVEEKTDLLLQLLQRGTLDAAMLALPITQEGVMTQALFTEPFLLAVPASHPLATRQTVDYESLQDITLLLLDEGHCLREQALDICRAIGTGEARHFRATSLETLRHMVAAGNAVTLMPALAALPNPAIVYIPFAESPPARTIGLCWRDMSARYILFSRLGTCITDSVVPQLD